MLDNVLFDNEEDALMTKCQTTMEFSDCEVDSDDEGLGYEDTSQCVCVSDCEADSDDEDLGYEDTSQ